MTSKEPKENKSLVALLEDPEIQRRACAAANRLAIRYRLPITGEDLYQRAMKLTGGLLKGELTAIGEKR